MGRKSRFASMAIGALVSIGLGFWAVKALMRPGSCWKHRRRAKEGRVLGATKQPRSRRDMPGLLPPPAQKPRGVAPRQRREDSVSQGRGRPVVWLSLFVLWAGFASISMTILVPLGLPRMLWMMLVFVPGLLTHAGLFLYAAKRDPVLLGRLKTGLWVGVLATMALDVVRLAGVSARVFPDMPSMFGAMVLTKKPVDEFMREVVSGRLRPDFNMTAATVVGYVLHYLNGVGLTTVFMVFLGGLRPPAGLWYGAGFVELMMLISPPVVMLLGPFGLRGGLGVFAVSFAAHLVFGAVLGHAGYKLIRPRGTFWTLPTTGAQTPSRSDSRRPAES